MGITWELVWKKILIRIEHTRQPPDPDSTKIGFTRHRDARDLANLPECATQTPVVRMANRFYSPLSPEYLVIKENQRTLE